jgi:hypothetical protein
MTSQHLHEFADWVESQPINGKEFRDWTNTFWPEYEKRCKDICANIYVMRECVAAFELRLQLGMDWEKAIGNDRLSQDIKDICGSVQMTPDDFFSGSARTVFERRCRMIFENRIQVH